jgi:hypothetical protein
MHLNVHMNIYTNMYVNIYTNVYLNTYMNAYMFVCMFKFICMHRDLYSTVHVRINFRIHFVHLQVHVTCTLICSCSTLKLCERLPCGIPWNCGNSMPIPTEVLKYESKTFRRKSVPPGLRGHLDHRNSIGSHFSGLFKHYTNKHGK